MRHFLPFFAVTPNVNFGLDIESSLSVETDAGSALDLEAVLSLLESIPTTLDAYTADVYALKAYDSQSVEERLGGLSEKEVAAKVGQVVNVSPDFHSLIPFALNKRSLSRVSLPGLT